MSAALEDNAVAHRAEARTTKQWQAADAAHYLHPFTDFKSLASKGSRSITTYAPVSGQ